MWRLIVAVILFLLSLLTVFKAPTNFFWKVAVAVTEFPYVPLMASLIFLVIFFKANSYKIASSVLTVAAFIFFSLPIIQAFLISGAVKRGIAQIFPNTTLQNEQSPFSFFKMFTGLGEGEVNPQSYIYKKIGHKELSLDFYKAAASGKKACLVVIHGGAWNSGDSKQLADLNSYIARRSDCHVAAINYRLAPEFKFPAQMDDTKDAVNFLAQHAEELNINADCFILLGRSAGGQMALLYAYSAHDPRVKGVVSFYGPADMAWGASIKTNKLVLDVERVFKDYLGGLINEAPEAYKQSTACNFVDPGSPKTLLIHGPNDAMVSFHHSERLEEKLKTNKVPYYFLRLPWATHGCDYNINGPSGQVSTYAVEEFIRGIIVNQ
jgi:acetyl esterase/lipase